MELISRSSPVGTPPASTTTSACSVKARAPSTPAISSARGGASAVVKARKLNIARQRTGRREGRVEVDERHDRRAAAGRVGDEVAADPRVGEDVVVEAVAEDPLM